MNGKAGTIRRAIGALLVLTALLSAGCSPLPKPLGDVSNLGEILNAASGNVKDGNWAGAREDARQLQDEWRRIRTRVLARTESSLNNDFEGAMETYRLAAEAEDEGSAISAIGTMRAEWNHLRAMLQ